MKKLKALICMIISAALLTSCSLSLTENKTAIKLVLPKYINSSSARGVLQYQQYDKEDINYYDVFCTPILDDEYWQKLHDDIEKNYDFTQENGNENFEELIYKTNEEFQHRYAELKNVKPGETVTITELLEGKYQISVTGYTANGDYAAWGFSEEFDLIANETKNETKNDENNKATEQIQTQNSDIRTNSEDVKVPTSIMYIGIAAIIALTACITILLINKKQEK